MCTYRIPEFEWKREDDFYTCNWNGCKLTIDHISEELIVTTDKEDVFCEFIESKKDIDILKQIAEGVAIRYVFRYLSENQ
jgi:hypothetical protein